MSIKYYTFDSDLDANIVVNKINSNCGWASNGTDSWDVPKYIEHINKWVVQKPVGSHGFTESQMNDGISATEAVSSPEWWPNDEV